MKFLKHFDNYIQQLEYLMSSEYNDGPKVLTNKINNIVNFSSDNIYDKVYKYADKAGNVLEEYLPLNYNYEHPKYYNIPPEAVYINVYNKYTNKLIERKKLSHIYNIETPLYTVGLISDVHYNDGDDVDTNPDTHVDDGAEYSEDLINAFNYFNEKHVDFISCSGDISTDSRKHLKNYKYCADKYSKSIPIFTCSGNHDTSPKFREPELFKEISALNIDSNQNIEFCGYFKDYEHAMYINNETGNRELMTSIEDGSSFYIKYHYEDTYDVYIYLNVEYGWDNEDYHTHNCRMLTQDELLVHTEVQPDDLHLYHPETLRQFANIMEQEKDHRCFIFTHIMFPDKAGNYHSYNNDICSESYYPYGETWEHADVMRGDQGEFIQGILEKYPRSFMFCGHSHYKWAWEQYDHNINVSQTGDSYNVHIPSLSRPLPINIYWYQNSPKDSEAGLMKVYKDYVIIDGIVMKEGNQEDTYEQLYEFPEENMTHVNLNHITLPENNESTVSYNENTNTLTINYQYNINGSSEDNDIHINIDSNVDESNYGNYIPVIRMDNVRIWHDGLSTEEEINEFTQNVINEQCVGFRYIGDEYIYLFESNHKYTMFNYGVNFKVSSKSIYKDYLLHIEISNLRIGYIHSKYINKKLPIASWYLSTKR